MITQVPWATVGWKAGVGQDGTALSLCCDRAGRQCFCDRFRNDGTAPNSKGDRALTTIVGNCKNVGKYLPSFSGGE